MNLELEPGSSPPNPELDPTVAYKSQYPGEITIITSVCLTAAALAIPELVFVATKGQLDLRPFREVILYTAPCLAVPTAILVLQAVRKSEERAVITEALVNSLADQEDAGS